MIEEISRDLSVFCNSLKFISHLESLSLNGIFF